MQGNCNYGRQFRGLADLRGLDPAGNRHSVIGAFYEVHNTLGHGFVDSLYATALTRELVDRGHVVEREVTVPVVYKGLEIGVQRMDMVVDKALILELKSSSTLNKEAPQQLVSYLKATRMEVGLLLHFGSGGARFYRVVSSNRGQSA